MATKRNTNDAQNDAPATEETETKSKRGMAAPLPELPISSMNAGLLPEKHRELTRPTKPSQQRERSETAKFFDAKVKEAHEAWIAAGKPTKKWADMPVAIVQTSTEHAETVVKYIRKGATFHGLKVRFGQRLTLGDGVQGVTFVAMDRPLKGEIGTVEE